MNESTAALLEESARLLRGECVDEANTRAQSENTKTSSGAPGKSLRGKQIKGRGLKDTNKLGTKQHGASLKGKISSSSSADRAQSLAQGEGPKKADMKGGSPTTKTKKKGKKKMDKNDEFSINFGPRMKRNSIAEIAADEKNLKLNHVQKHGGVGAPNTNMKKVLSEKTTLEDREWENELARSILTLYHANTTETDPLDMSAVRSNKKKLDPIDKVKKKKLRQPTHLWFAGTGGVKAIWCALSEEHNSEKDAQHISRYDKCDCTHRICVELRDLNEKGKYETYIDILVELLQSFCRENTFHRLEKKQEENMEKLKKIHGAGSPINGHTCELGTGDPNNAKKKKVLSSFEMRELVDNQEDLLLTYETVDPTLLVDDKQNQMETMMWRQLVVCCNIFGFKLTEQGKYGPALNLFKRAENLMNSSSAIEGGNAFVGKIKTQLQGFIWDSMAFYYYKRRKCNAAASYAQKAMRAHVKLNQWDHVAKCHLHCGAILSMMSKHEESIKCMAQVLEMVEDERLQVGGTNARKICMVAVCYHNIAVEQLILRRPAEACVSSQNGRKLARLSLSYANRWLSKFENTHQFALREVSSQHAFLLDRPTNLDAKPNYLKSRTQQEQQAVRDSLKNPKAKKFYNEIAKALE